MKNEDVYRISDETFIEIIKDSKNIHESLNKMGLNARGAAYKTFKRRVKALGIDLSHFIKDKNLRKLLTITGDDQIKNACMQSISRQASLKLLKLDPHIGSNIKWLNITINKLDIDTSHWLGEAQLRGKNIIGQ